MSVNYFFTRGRRFLLLFLFAFSICFAANAQQIHLNFKDIPLKNVLKELSAQSGYSFAYSDALQQVEQRVTCNIESNGGIESVLKELFKEKKISYKINGNQIILAPEGIAVKKGPEVKSLKATGVITDEAGEPLAGVTVHNQKTGKITASVLDGSYTIEVHEGDPLLFTSIGFGDVIMTVAKSMRINVVMRQDNVTLDEVMVVAYGTAKKSTFTGSAATVGEKTFMDRPLTEVSQALNGTTAGLQIGTSNGQPGSAPTIRIRGLGSFNASNSPLIVLDGMPFDNSITSINPNDIETVTVLKDASSAALYGARAANGVILINTKKGKKGNMKITAKYNIGLISRQTKDYETVGIEDYMQLYWESNRNRLMFGGMSQAEANAGAGNALLAGISYNPYNMGAGELFDTSNGKINKNAQLLWADDLDWISQVQRTGIRHDASFSLAGADDKTDYYASVGYIDENGYIIGSDLKRYSAKANVNSQVTKWMKVGINLNAAIMESNGNQNETEGSLANPFRFTRYIGNIYPIHLHNPATGEYIYDATGNKIYDFGIGYTTDDGVAIPKRECLSGVNPAYELKHRYDGYKRNTINAKAYVEIPFLRDFKFTANVGLGDNMYRGWSGDYVIPEKGNAGTSTKSDSNTTTWNINQILSYNKDIGKHHIDAMVGHESYDYKYTYNISSMKGQIIAGDNFEFKNYTEVNGTPNAYVNTYKVEGYLSRLNYDYDNKYFASASYRRDGSSRFYKDVRWGNFWSVGAGWRIDREKFMKDVEFVNLLKLRASYGVVGNDDLSSYYPWQATYAPYPNGTTAGYLQSSLGNKELTWEESRNLDVALEFGLFKSRFNGTVEFFNRESSNLLFNVPEPPSTGVDDVSLNAGTMYNRGVEVTLDYTILENKAWRWSVNANATFLNNKISKLPVDPYKSSLYKIQEGHSRYSFWLKQWYGVNPETGYNLFVADVDNESYVWEENELMEINGVQYTENIDHAKYDWSGNGMSKVTGGFGSALSWKNWTFSFSFYYQLGGKYYDSTYMTLMNSSGNLQSYGSLHKDLLNRWQKAGDVTDVARLTNGSDNENVRASSSTRWLVSSNTLELTNISLGYTIPQKYLKGIKINSLKLYFSADNPLLITAHRGMFPRRNFSSGYDGNADLYLPSKTFSFGLTVNF